MTPPVLTLRDLNRATLVRQLLLERSVLPVPQALEHLAGLQAQLPVSPYVALWTRLADFRREALATLIEARRVVKATLMRATLHLMTAEDYLRLRATLAPVLSGASQDIARQRGQALDVPRLLDAARAYLAASPRTFAALSAMLAAVAPDADVGAMRYTVRTHLPLVQVPVGKGWSYPGNPEFALADAWLGRAPDAQAQPETLVRRFLAAFGPATAADAQTWSGLAEVRGVLKRLAPELTVYRDERRRELYDLPGAPLPGDVPAPVRFLPEFDNLLLAHKDRTRVLADAYRARVYLPGLRVRATFLVDGFVAGAWRVDVAKKQAALVLEPFAPLAADARAALLDEAERLVRFVAADAASHAVRVEEA